jgi:hypothetical protein
LKPGPEETVNKNMVNHPLLTDPDTFPSNDVLAVALGKSFNAFEQFIDRVTNTDFNLDMQWNYYKDGKSWLCKITGNKKTVFWLSYGTLFKD